MIGWSPCDVLTWSQAGRSAVTIQTSGDFLDWIKSGCCLAVERRLASPWGRTVTPGCVTEHVVHCCPGETGTNCGTNRDSVSGANRVQSR